MAQNKKLKDEIDVLRRERVVFLHICADLDNRIRDSTKASREVSMATSKRMKNAEKTYE